MASDGSSVKRLPWLVLADLCATAGQLVALITRRVSFQDVPVPVAVGLSLLEYPLFVLGLVLIIRAKGLMGDLRATINALIMTIGMGLLLAWASLIRPHEAALGLSVQSKMLAIAYPVGDVIILGVLAQLPTIATSSSAPRPAPAPCCSSWCCRAWGT